ncbi:DUF488 family protein [Allochromatium palmeri]|uniref:DUF488 family protein n=1 Tax=Allochromatium palmeri TaxID=231048 RepID=A0A6N8EKP1_9GAMM|nr:DUF488 domain-containing protein [Allochromatium palmeri]MTW23127.1 DUF488 family protein [Allochromatium palmeri]
MLYTLGHSDHTLEAFLDLLQRHRITAIADVRSAPYSRRHPQFNREPLQAALREAGVAYVFLGRECGARSDDPAALRDGQVDYERLAETSRFRDGVTRIVQGAQRYRLAMLCAERDPMTCHRTILVSRSLVDQGRPVEHILYDGALEPHAATLRRLRAHLGLEHPDLFHTDAELEALAYRQQGERLAYRPDELHDTESNP